MATVARPQIAAALMFAKALDEIIALADIKASGTEALKDINEVRDKVTGRGDWI